MSFGGESRTGFGHVGVMPVAPTVAGMSPVAMTVTLDHLQPNGPSFAQVLCVCVCVLCMCV